MDGLYSCLLDSPPSLRGGGKGIHNFLHTNSGPFNLLNIIDEAEIV